MMFFHTGSVLPLLSLVTGRVLPFVSPAETDHLLDHELAIGQLTHIHCIGDPRCRACCANVGATMIPELRETASLIFDLQGRAIPIATALAPGKLAWACGADIKAELGDVGRQLRIQLGWRHA